jgi:hypothetical protein
MSEPDGRTSTSLRLYPTHLRRTQSPTWNGADGSPKSIGQFAPIYVGWRLESTCAGEIGPTGTSLSCSSAFPAALCPINMGCWTRTGP